MGKHKIALLDAHAQNYIHTVMSEQLHRGGYANKGGKVFHWYRVVDDAVLQTVYFYTQWKAMPIFMSIGYGCHPLFIPPEYPSGIQVSMQRSYEVVNPGRVIGKRGQNISNSIFSPEAAVMCPNDQFRGADILTSVLELQNGIRSIEQCYAMHKQRHIDAAEQLRLPSQETFRRVSVDFMTEAAYFNDTELFPVFIPRINSEIDRYTKAQASRSLWNIEKYELQAYLQLKKAVIEQQREDFLAYLQERQTNNTIMLKRKVKDIIL